MKEWDAVGVVMGVVKGEIEFSRRSEVRYHIYRGIPLGKPLVSCVTLNNEEKSIEFIIKTTKKRKNKTKLNYLLCPCLITEMNRSPD